MNSNKLMDALKKQQGITSDYALAQFLKVSQQAITNMRATGLSDERALQFATLLGLDPAEVLASIHAERAKDPEVRKVWEKLVKTLATRAAAVLVALGLPAILIVGTPAPAEAAQISLGIHYAKRRLRRSWAAVCGLLACFGLISGPVLASDWTNEDTAWEASYMALWVTDWRQTLNIERNPALEETNRFLGPHPEDSKINRYFFGSAVLHAGLAYILPRGWRRVFQVVTIGMEADAVSTNYQLGLSVSF